MSDKALVLKPIFQPKEILTSLQSGQLFAVSGTRGSALVICHRHYAEILGPGAAVGSLFDLDCQRAIPIGNAKLIYPESRAQRQQAYALRQKWISYMQKVTGSAVPLQRATSLLGLLAKYFGKEAIEQIPDEILAQLVGVLPKTMQMAKIAKTDLQISRQQAEASAVVS